MSGLLTLLLFAGLFYFMMRFGCGAHMVHGHGGGAQHDQAGHAGRSGWGVPTSHGGQAERGAPANQLQGSTATDPVCGMAVAPGQGYSKMHEGREYRLCSRACLDKFDANPAQYVSGRGAAS